MLLVVLSVGALQGPTCNSTAVLGSACAEQLQRPSCANANFSWLRAGRPPPPRLALSEILQRAITFIRDIFPFGLVSSSCGGVWEDTVADDRERGV